MSYEQNAFQILSTQTIQNMLVYSCHWRPVLSSKTFCRKAEEKTPNKSESIYSDRSKKLNGEIKDIANCKIQNT